MYLEALRLFSSVRTYSALQRSGMGIVYEKDAKHI